VHLSDALEAHKSHDGVTLNEDEDKQPGVRASLPPEEARAALAFVVNAHAATVNMRLYPLSSSMVVETFEKAKEALDQIFKSSERIGVATVENNLLINDTRLDDIDQQKAPVRSFIAWMNERGLSNIEFNRGVTGDELQNVFSVMGAVTDMADRSKLTDELVERGVEHVSVNQRVYVAVATSDTGEIIGTMSGPSAPLDALKDELLIRYLMGKIDLGSVEDRELLEVLSDPGKVGGLLSTFLSEEGSEGGVLMKSQKAEEALTSLAEMVDQIEDESLRESMASQITSVVAEMSPREMTSVLTGHAPETLNIKHIRENVLTMLSDNQLLDMIDSLIDEYVEMKEEVGDLQPTWTRERLNGLNELLTEVRGDRGSEIGTAIDKKLDAAGIAEERDPHTGTRVLSAYQMLGGRLEEEDVQLDDGVDNTVPKQIRQLYAMEESDLAAGMLLKLAENFKSDSPTVRRFASRLADETLDGLDEEHGALAVDVLYNELVSAMGREDDYESFQNMVQTASKTAQLYMKAGSAEQAGSILELLMSLSSAESGKGEELKKVAVDATTELMGPEGMIDPEALLLEPDADKRLKTIKALASLGPDALSPLVDMVKDRGRIEFRDGVLEALQSAGAPGVTAIVRELEKENPWYVYRNMLNVVADLRLAEGLPQVSALASNPDERIRREAIRTLARIGSRDSLGVVMNGANDASPAVRRTAVRVLGLFGDSSVAPFLLEIINGQGMRGKEEDHAVMEAACLAVGDLRDSSYVPQLAELMSKGGLFKKGRPDEIRAAAAVALGTIGDPLAIPVLEKAAKDQSVMVHSSADKSLRRLKGGPMAAEPVAPDEEAAVLGLTGLHERRSPTVTPQSLPFQQPPQPVQPEFVSQGRDVAAPAQRPFEPHVYPPAAPEAPAQQPVTRQPQPTPPAVDQPPQEPKAEASLPGHTLPSETPVPPDLAKMWPQGGSLNGHDFPVPPAPPVAAEPAEVPEQVPPGALPPKDPQEPLPPPPAPPTSQSGWK